MNAGDRTVVSLHCEEGEGGGGKGAKCQAAKGMEGGDVALVRNRVHNNNIIELSVGYCTYSRERSRRML